MCHLSVAASKAKQGTSKPDEGATCDWKRDRDDSTTTAQPPSPADGPSIHPTPTSTGPPIYIHRFVGLVHHMFALSGLISPESISLIPIILQSKKPHSVLIYSSKAAAPFFTSAHGPRLGLSCVLAFAPSLPSLLAAKFRVSPPSRRRTHSRVSSGCDKGLN